MCPTSGIKMSEGNECLSQSMRSEENEKRRDDECWRPRCIDEGAAAHGVSLQLCSVGVGVGCCIFGGYSRQ